jgi:hypothetical protein
VGEDQIRLRFDEVDKDGRPWVDRRGGLGLVRLAESKPSSSWTSSHAAAQRYSTKGPIARTPLASIPDALQTISFEFTVG